MRVFPQSIPFQRKIVAPPSTIFQTMNPQVYEGDWIEITDDTPFTFQSQTTAIDIPGMLYEAPASGVYLIISSLEVYWDNGVGEFFISQIADNGTGVGNSTRYIKAEPSLDQQTFTITTFAARSDPSNVTMRVFSASNGIQTWTVKKRTLSLLRIPAKDILVVANNGFISTASTDFSVTMTDMQATQGTTLMFDSSTMRSGTYLVLFGTYSWMNSVVGAGAASEFRLYQNGTEVAAHLRRRIDWEADIADTSNVRMPVFIAGVVQVGDGEVTSIRWAEPNGIETIQADHRMMVMIRVSPIDCRMVGGTVEDSEVTADTYKIIDDLDINKPGTSQWLGLWSLNMHADETTAPGEQLTFALSTNTTNPSGSQFTTERRQTYPDVFGLSDAFVNAMGHGRIDQGKNNAHLVWKSDLTTSRSVLNRTLVIWRPDTSDWPARYVPNNPLLKM